MQQIITISPDMQARAKGRNRHYELAEIEHWMPWSPNDAHRLSRFEFWSSRRGNSVEPPAYIEARTNSMAELLTEMLALVLPDVDDAGYASECVVMAMKAALRRMPPEHARAVASEIMADALTR